MGSQSSSGMSGGGGSSSGNPAEQSETDEVNQDSSSRGRRTADRQQGDRQPSSEEDVDLAEVLAYLLRRWTGATVGFPHVLSCLGPVWRIVVIHVVTVIEFLDSCKWWKDKSVWHIKD